MSLHPQPIPDIPSETKRVTHAALPKGSTITRLRDEFGAVYTDQDFSDLFPTRGQPALAPWRLALITVMQFVEHLTDRQAAQAVQTRLDWKYALSLELTDVGFDFTVLSEFRTRLIQGKAELRLLDKVLYVFKDRGLLKTRGRQRSDSTHVIANVRCLSLIEFIGETLRATLNDLAEAAP
jgi:transposase